MSYQTHTFVKQVQIDLLALSDADLLQTIDQWGHGKELSTLSHDAPEVTLSALGYTHTSPETEYVSNPFGDEPEALEQWIAPSPPHLRRLLSEMDLKQFAQHVISIAFQSLHRTYPEWGDGSTFNAHLANHLRWMRAKQQRYFQDT
jgi:hypothetical protein